jgi:hypothetical protein
MKGIRRAACQPKDAEVSNTFFIKLIGRILRLSVRLPFCPKQRKLWSLWLFIKKDFVSLQHTYNQAFK